VFPRDLGVPRELRPGCGRHLDAIESREELITPCRAASGGRVGPSPAVYSSVLVAKAAWLSTKRNASQSLLQALAGYATAIRRIGHGRGPNATRYFGAMRGKRCWMPPGAVPLLDHESIARISESHTRRDRGAFDL